MPISIAETVEATRACVAAGADALHLHVRNGAGHHSLDIGLYKEALAEVQATLPRLPVQVTTEAAGVFDVAAQLAVIRDLKPDWASVALREVAAEPELARTLYETAADQGTELQHIIYDEADAALLAAHQRGGLLTEDASVILVLGRYAQDFQSDPADLPALRATLPPVGKWMLCAFGRNEHACLRAAARLGGDMRVGFENSHTDADGVAWPDMASSVKALRNSLEAAE
ncbi:3-keto-5-aminohexanoate cleavage protein [Tropicimonas sp. S265A]|uniref:3-keto-5-aminohexanoate cleavage protein n=1 Tax=Tropicimonas sp. S265A TaxID=3415134 RepID=UPI003C7CECAC